MSRRGLLLPLLALLSACEDPLAEDCFGFWEVDMARPTPDPGISGLALRTRDLSARADIAGVDRMSAWVTVENLDGAADCLVAVYASDAPVSKADLPALSADAPPPATLDGLGTLQGHAHLAADRVDHPDSEMFEVPLPAPIEGTPTWITIATCGDADLALRVELEGDYCGGWDDDLSFEGAFSRVF